jgi:prevent-host-death family protein
MRTVTLRELQNDCEAILDRVARGEVLVVTRDGVEVAELRSRSLAAPATAELMERRRYFPRIDTDLFRHDIDGVLNDVTTAWSYL